MNKKLIDQSIKQSVACVEVVLFWMCTLSFFLFSLFSGNTPETRGTAFVVYEDIFDAKNACDHLSGFNVCNRYLVVLYYQSTKVSAPY